MIKERFLKLSINVYTGDKYREWAKNRSRRDNDEELENWQKDKLEQEAPPPPPPIIARLRIDPDLITSYSEAFSLEESESNPDNPMCDATEICMRTGELYVANINIDKFEKLVDDFYKQKPVVPQQQQPIFLLAEVTHDTDFIEEDNI